MPRDFAREVETLRSRAEVAEATLRARDIAEAEKRERDATAIREANQTQRNRERAEALVAETEKTRQASWLRWLTLPGENVTRLAYNDFSPTYIKDHTPDSPDAWPPDDAPHNHKFHFSGESPLPGDSPGTAPKLVQMARERGMKV